jgi:hypothetical protein
MSKIINSWKEKCAIYNVSESEHLIAKVYNFILARYICFLYSSNDNWSDECSF